MTLKPRASREQVEAAASLARTLGRSPAEVLEALGLRAPAEPRRRARDRRKLAEPAPCAACPPYVAPDKRQAVGYLPGPHGMKALCREHMHTRRATGRNLACHWLRIWAGMETRNDRQTLCGDWIRLDGPQARLRAAASLRATREFAANIYDRATKTPSGRPSRKPVPDHVVTAELYPRKDGTSPCGIYKLNSTGANAFFPWKILTRNRRLGTHSRIRQGGKLYPYWQYTVAELSALRAEVWVDWRATVRERPSCDSCGSFFVWKDDGARDQWLREGRPRKVCCSCYVNAWIEAAPAPVGEGLAYVGLRVEEW